MVGVGDKNGVGVEEGDGVGVGVRDDNPIGRHEVINNIHINNG
jgi:hypothetical protein